MSKFFTSLTLSIIFFLFLSCDNQSTKGPSSAKLNTVGTQNSEIAANPNDPHANFVGHQACAECHKTEHEEWLGSDHKNAMAPATEKSVLGNFDNQSLEINGVTHRFYRAKNGDFMVEADSEKGEMTSYKVEYVLGYEPLQQYMVKLPGNRIQCLHTAWNTTKKEWYHLYKDENPPAGDWLHWTGQGMTWNSQCADCHTTNTQINYDRASNSFNTNYSEGNVSCEACHGPGKNHVNHYKGDTSIVDDLIKLTKKSGATQQEELNRCAPCHGLRSRLDQAVNPHGSIGDSYAMNLARNGQYQADGQILTEVFVYGSFTQSRHHRFGLRCSDCHNPHTGKIKFPGNKTCTECHLPDQYDTPKHTFHTDPEGSKCISCHMPGRFYMGVDFRHDHSFRVPRPDLSRRYSTSNACNDCHTDRNFTWAAQAIEKNYGPTRKAHFSEVLLSLRNNEPGSVEKAIQLLKTPELTPVMGRAAILSELPATYSPEVIMTIEKQLKDASSLVRHAAVEICDPLSNPEKLRLLVPILKDKARSVRQEVAFILSAIPDQDFPSASQSERKNAEDEFILASESTADSPGSLLRFGIFEERKGNHAKALELYQASLKVDILFHPARSSMATLYSRQGKNDLAEKELRIIVSQYPQLAQFQYMLGQLLAEEKRYMEAQKSFAKAAALPNCPPQVFRNWGLSMEKMGQHDQALKIYRSGLQVYPGYGELQAFIQRIEGARKQQQEREQRRQQQQQQAPQ
ncbi:multiheme c-type cytochrome [Lentisphaera profundi]|uniref:Multiheme c-type cytochrome n=1 Tax=Lentisphaera profundi TaxID=1658616 RepID=A0ABY7W129_9BACT|nr:tetratricopeptide repeat protein [Lentisphaera profundi]WDE97978.1 multiheme c-type cytochrome [Lentisphaera profundi]